MGTCAWKRTVCSFLSKSRPRTIASKMDARQRSSQDETPNRLPPQCYFDTALIWRWLRVPALLPIMHALTRVVERRGVMWALQHALHHANGAWRLPFDEKRAQRASQAQQPEGCSTTPSIRSAVTFLSNPPLSSRRVIARQFVDPAADRPAFASQLVASADAFYSRRGFSYTRVRSTPRHLPLHLPAAVARKIWQKRVYHPRSGSVETAVHDARQ